MVVSTEVTVRRYTNVSAGTPISVDIPAYEASDVVVYYGSAALVAVQGTDYTVSLAEDFDTFTVTPLAALISKIDALIAADDTETNFISVRRILGYTTSATAASVRYTPYTSREFDRAVMRDQQLKDEAARTLRLNEAYAPPYPSLALGTAPDDDPYALILEAGVLKLGPKTTDIEDAQANAETASAAKTAAQVAAAQAALYGGVRIESHEDIEADTSLSGDAEEPGYVAVGGYVHTKAENFVYERVVSGEDRVTAGGIKLAAVAAPAEYTDRSFGIAADGSTDDAAKYALMAAHIPAGKTLRLVGAGVRIIGSALTFAQANLSIVADAGVVLKQKSSTLTIDTLLTVSGERSRVQGLTMDANRAGNATASYTGRGELLKLSGARQVLRDATILDGHVKPFATGVYITGNDVLVDGLTGYETGRILIRGRADRPTIRNVVGFDIQDATPHADDTFVTGSKVLVWDGGSESNDPFTWLLFDNIAGHSDTATFQELIVVDSSTEIGGRVIARNLLANYPNSVGPDVCKFVNFRRLDLDGLTTFHAGDAASNASLRLQQDDALAFTGRREVNLKGLDLAGHINFDGDTELDLRVDGTSRIGRDIDGPTCIDDLPYGTVAVADGARFERFTTSVFGSRNDTPFPQMSLGRCGYVGASTGDATLRQIALARLEIVTTQARRTRARMITIAEPLEIRNTRKPPTEARWVLDQDTTELGVEQAEGVAVSGTDFSASGPRDAEGWRRGTKIMRRDPSANQLSALRCTTSGASCQTAWAGSTAYTVGNWRYNGANVYVCTTAGTSAASGGPTGTGTGITDGTAVWSYVDVRAVWSTDGAMGLVFDTALQFAALTAGVNTSGKFKGKLGYTDNNYLVVALGDSAASGWAALGADTIITPA